MTPVPVVIVQPHQRARATSPLTMLDWNDDHYCTCDLDVYEEQEEGYLEKEEEKDKDSDDDIPQEFICPLTLEIMATPMMTRTGHNYERHAILCWLENHTRCPLTRQPLSLRDCVINSALGLKIQNWQKQQKLQKESSLSRDCHTGHEHGQYGGTNVDASDGSVKNGILNHDVHSDAESDGYLAQCCAKNDLGLLCSCSPSKDLINAIERRGDLDSQILAQILKNARKHMKQERRQLQQRQQQQQQRELQDLDQQRQQRQLQSNVRSTSGTNEAAIVTSESTGRHARAHRRFRNRFGFSSLRATAA